MPLPPFRAAPVHLRVPASSANLGPGFDSLGLALGIYNAVAVRIVESGLTVNIAGEGADTLPRDESNLLVRAMRATFDALGGQPGGLEVRCTNRIPGAGGLGSSAAAIVGGLAAARALVPGGMTDDDVLALSTEMEGHPDNVAACLLGGATAAWTDAGGRPHAVRLLLSPALLPVVFVPVAGRQSTRAARALLPAQVPHADAAVTAARAALLVHALEHCPELLLTATDDALHQPYRLAQQPATAALVARLRAAGIAAVLSGSGPTALALTASPEQGAAATVLAGTDFMACTVPVDPVGAAVVEEP